MTDLKLSGDVLSCSIEIIIIRYGLQGWQIDNKLKELVDGLSSLNSFDTFLWMKKWEEHSLFVVILLSGGYDWVEHRWIFSENIQLLP